MVVHARVCNVDAFQIFYYVCVCLTLTTARRNSIFFPQTSLTSVSTTISVSKDFKREKKLARPWKEYKTSAGGRDDRLVTGRWTQLAFSLHLQLKEF